MSWEIDDGAIIGYHDYGVVGSDYEIVSTGDFNGDGKSGDIVWRHVGGQVVTWELDGGTQVGYHDFGIVTNDYTIEDTGDYNGDGHSDILWRHYAGSVITWELNGGAIIGFHNFGTVDRFGKSSRRRRACEEHGTGPPPLRAPARLRS